MWISGVTKWVIGVINLLAKSPDPPSRITCSMGLKGPLEFLGLEVRVLGGFNGP